ncbi:unnamed protein product [Prorocentrum cordatum]|uniref:Uncharacterized protein n=1 Tax=Prorocentrum cordatum TaxID=2364126 RepID=A0ABN9SSM2_9DINO|nr:unnamed protein product [Polarella glacialis]
MDFGQAWPLLSQWGTAAFGAALGQFVRECPQHCHSDGDCRGDPIIGAAPAPLPAAEAPAILMEVFFLGVLAGVAIALSVLSPPQAATISGSQAPARAGGEAPTGAVQSGKTGGNGSVSAMAAAGAAAAAVLDRGSAAWVHYGAAEHHARLVGARVENDEYVVASPDYDLFIEQLSLNSADLEGESSPGSVLYTFAPLTVAEISGLLAEAGQVCNLERTHRGLPRLGEAARAPGGAAAVAIPVPAVAPAPGGARLAPAGGVWVPTEPLVGHDIGAEFALPVGAAVLGTRALVVIDGSVASLEMLAEGVDITWWPSLAVLCGDPRIPAWAPTERALVEAVGLMTACARQSEGLPPSPLLRPFVGAEWIDSVIRGGVASLVARADKWRSDSGARQHSSAAHEHSILHRAVHLLATVDGLNVKNMVGVELLLRRITLHKEAVAENPDALSYEGGLPPLPDAPRRLRPGNGSGGKARLHRERRAAVQSAAQEAVDGLGLLFGRDPRELSAPPLREGAGADVGRSSARSAIHRHLLATIASGLPDHVQSGHGSLCELAGSIVDYETLACAVGPCDPTEVSLPKVQVSPVDLIYIVSPELGRCLDLENMLADADVVEHGLRCEPAGSDADAPIQGGEDIEVTFLRSLIDCGLMHQRLPPSERAPRRRALAADLGPLVDAAASDAGPRDLDVLGGAPSELTRQPRAGAPKTPQSTILGRSSSAEHLQLVRRLAALSIATGSWVAHRWAPSEFNPNAPSRLFDQLTKARSTPYEAPTPEAAGTPVGVEPRRTVPSVGRGRGRGAPRRRAAAAPSPAARPLALTLGRRAQTGGLGACELATVSSKGASARAHFEGLFRARRQRRGRPTNDRSELEVNLLDYLDELPADNAKLAHAEKTARGLLYSTLPGKIRDYSRLQRALEGCKKRLPPVSRMPLPIEVESGVCALLIGDGEGAAAPCVETVFAGSCRPGEVLRAAVGDLERLLPSKTQAFDDAVAFDYPGWLGDVTGARLGVDASLCQLRRGGASDDLLKRRRALGEIQYRVRYWRMGLRVLVHRCFLAVSKDDGWRTGPTMGISVVREVQSWPHLYAFQLATAAAHLGTPTRYPMAAVLTLGQARPIIVVQTREWFRSCWLVGPTMGTVWIAE